MFIDGRRTKLRGDCQAHGCQRTHCNLITHSQEVYAKLNVHNRSELASKLLLLVKRGYGD